MTFWGDALLESTALGSVGAVLGRRFWDVLIPTSCQMLQGQINLALGKLCHMKFNRAKTRTELIPLNYWIPILAAWSSLLRWTANYHLVPGGASYGEISNDRRVWRLKGRFHILSFDIIPVATCASELVCGGSATFRLGRDTTALGGSSIALQVAAEPFFSFQ